MKSYLPLGQLTGVHTDSINCTAFSADGKFLATGSDDCSLAIWSVDDGSSIAQHHLNSPILTAVWDLHVCKRLYFGCIDGTAAYIDEPHVRLIDYPWEFRHRALQGSIHYIRTGVGNLAVYAFAVSHRTPNIALSVGYEVHIAAPMNVNSALSPYCSQFPCLTSNLGSYASVTILPKPMSLSESKSEPPDSEFADVWGRSLHFLGSGSKLLASYLNHGIVYVSIWLVMIVEH